MIWNRKLKLLGITSLVLRLKNNRTKIFIIWTILLLIITITGLLSYKVYQFMLKVTVNSIVIDGASIGVKRQILASMQELYNQPILNINLEKLRDFIKRSPWIETASVQRNLNGQLNIFIVEKNPYFLWQDDEGDYKIIDSNNNPIKIKLKFSVDNLIVIEKGKKALENANELKLLIYKDIDFLRKIKKLSFNGYRWDIYLKNGIIIKMPEKNIEQAYDMIVKTNKKTNMLSKKIEYIDATSENKLFINPIKR